ncbi:MAG TPA: OmpA family protein [Bryobacteraceae bacterium]|jgi:outer membrane protein OmpA-like peptidoglycan-associated protein
MRHNLSIRTFAVTAVTLALLGVGSLSELRAQENASHLTGQEASKPPINTEDLESCTLVTLNRVFFRYDQKVLSAEEKVALDALANRFSRTAQSVIELRGYTDGMESSQHETELGTIRSQAIADYLVARGIPSDSILLVPTGAGDDQDKSMNPQHRRVDVRVFATAGSNSVNATRQSIGSKPSKGA